MFLFELVLISIPAINEAQTLRLIARSAAT